MSGINEHRYARQIALEEIGMEGQCKITVASVLVIGAGGLGCPALLYLAAAGIGKLGIADFDTVDESNLQRQVLYTLADIGKPKAATAAEKLKALNPNVEVEIFEDGLTPENAEEIFSGFDIILDGSDNFETKFLINDAALKTGKPWIYGALNKFEGQVALFDGGACYRCLFPEPPKERIMNCAEAGVIGAVAGMVGTVQASEAIKFITGLERLSGKLWMMDAKTMQTRCLSVSKDENCPCAAPQDIILETAHETICLSQTEVSMEEAQNIKDALWVDVREEAELLTGFVPGAVNLPLSHLLYGGSCDLPKNKPLVVYCQKGFRSLDATAILKARGYAALWSLKGGYQGWLASQAGRLYSRT